MWVKLNRGKFIRDFARGLLDQFFKGTLLNSYLSIWLCMKALTFEWPTGYIFTDIDAL